ncbi:TetR/AcrR family transcriptional regulator [Oligoflexus tunisiensis]|uniref:TetR/AcrR family transcriptional regulator n=1 Tax=Oligoflexus tunisiensis TaxID=708132 RepID=UPI000B01F5BA|nr:TetR/AcrR family transcriptional regulator [Oligoflexus tunisiensis]
MRLRMDGEQTRENILTVASKIFARHGYEGTSLRMIAAEAGVTFSVISHHFGDKANLLAKVREKAEKDFLLIFESLLSDNIQTWDDVIDGIFKFWDADPDRLRHYLWMFMDAQIHGISTPFHFGAVEQFFQSLAKKLNLPDAIEARSLMMIITGTCHHWLMRQWTHTSTPSKQQITTTLKTLLNSPRRLES